MAGVEEIRAGIALANEKASASIAALQQAAQSLEEAQQSLAQARRNQTMVGTLFINLDLYREAFVFNRMGYAAAIAWLLFVIVMALTLGLFAFARKRVYYAGGDR